MLIDGPLETVAIEMLRMRILIVVVQLLCDATGNSTLLLNIHSSKKTSIVYHIYATDKTQKIPFADSQQMIHLVLIPIIVIAVAPFQII